VRDAEKRFANWEGLKSEGSTQAALFSLAGNRQRAKHKFSGPLRAGASSATTAPLSEENTTARMAAEQEAKTEPHCVARAHPDQPPGNRPPILRRNNQAPASSQGRSPGFLSHGCQSMGPSPFSAWCGRSNLRREVAFQRLWFWVILRGFSASFRSKNTLISRFKPAGRPKGIGTTNQLLRHTGRVSLRTMPLHRPRRINETSTA